MSIQQHHQPTYSTPMMWVNSQGQIPFLPEDSQLTYQGVDPYGFHYQDWQIPAYTETPYGTHYGHVTERLFLVYAQNAYAEQFPVVAEDQVGYAQTNPEDIFNASDEIIDIIAPPKTTVKKPKLSDYEQFLVNIDRGDYLVDREDYKTHKIFQSTALESARLHDVPKELYERIADLTKFEGLHKGQLSLSIPVKLKVPSSDNITLQNGSLIKRIKETRAVLEIGITSNGKAYHTFFKPIANNDCLRSRYPEIAKSLLSTWAANKNKYTTTNSSGMQITAYLNK